MSRVVVRKQSAIFLVGLMLFCLSAARADIYTYSIGNSLTVDSNVAGMAEMAASRGTTVHADRHIHAGVRLDYIWDHPYTTTETPYFAGSYPTALAGYTWNAVTVQPFYQYLNGVGGDADITVRFMNLARQGNPANVNTQFYIFARWPELGTFSPTYGDIWNSNYAGDNGATTATVDFNRQIIDKVRKLQPQDMPPIQLIPTGHVLAEIDRQIRSGDLTGVTSIVDFYRDNTHLSVLGCFVASMTFYATIFDDNPLGLTPPTGFPAFDPSLVADLQTIIWNVVNRRPWDQRSPEAPPAPPASSIPEPALASWMILGFFMGRPRRS